MKIIDAHLHLFSEDSAEEMARQVGHHNNVDHLREVYGELHIAHGVVMGNHSLELRRHDYPTDLFHYCVGLDSSLLEDGSRVIPDLADRVEAHLRRDNCCGVKLYPGYNKIALSDPMYQPIYRLAARYGKPVAVHMGLTAFSRAHLKYCHPLALDEVAADHPDTQFVMCHFGNPFLEAAAAVVEKKSQCGRRPVRPSGGAGGPGRLFPGAGGLRVPAAHLADGHPVLGQGDVRDRLAHCQPGRIYRLYPPAGAGDTLGAGVL